MFKLLFVIVLLVLIQASIIVNGFCVKPTTSPPQDVQDTIPPKSDKVMQKTVQQENVAPIENAEGDNLGTRQISFNNGSAFSTNPALSALFTDGFQGTTPGVVGLGDGTNPMMESLLNSMIVQNMRSMLARSVLGDLTNQLNYLPANGAVSAVAPLAVPASSIINGDNTPTLGASGSGIFPVGRRLITNLISGLGRQVGLNDGVTSNVPLMNMLNGLGQMVGGSEGWNGAINRGWGAIASQMQPGGLLSNLIQSINQRGQVQNGDGVVVPGAGESTNPAMATLDSFLGDFLTPSGTFSATDTTPGLFSVERDPLSVDSSTTDIVQDPLQLLAEVEE